MFPIAESGLQQINFRFFAVSQVNLDNIITMDDIVVFKHAEPCSRTRTDQIAFFLIDGPPSLPLTFNGSCFYFDKDKRITISTHQINFSRIPFFPIAAQDMIAARKQKRFSRHLTIQAHPLRPWFARASRTILQKFRETAIPIVQQAQTNGDATDKAHTSATPPCALLYHSLYS